ncbi:MAG: hypothetical protein IJ837_01525 [Clostridia bacterium]|nr:hypothetical protein [Clostridia bacterium]
MISKTFTNEQAMNHLGYALTCGYAFEKFVFGKGVYGNRVSLIRDKRVANLFGGENQFKFSSFHVIEGIKPLEIPQTILLTRAKLESFYTKKEDMLDFLENYKQEFISLEDMEKVADNWYENVSKKLLVSKVIDFNRLNGFLINKIILYLPLVAQMDIAEFRKKQILILLTQQIITEDFARKQVEIMPASQDKLVALKQKILMQRGVK